MTDLLETSDARAARLAETPWQDAGASSGVAASASSIREIWDHRRLLGLLTRRELKARYKDSALGFVWSLIKPLTQLLIYWLVIGQFLGAARGIPDFAVYIFGGLTIYTLFSEIVGGGTGSIIANAGLVKKVYLPREIFPLAAVGSALFNFVIQFVILLIAALAFGTLSFGPHLLYGVGSIVLVLLYGTAIGILLAALNVYLRDVQYLVEVVLLLMMWGSPILYTWQQASTSLPGWLTEIYIDNPVTLAVLGFQEAIWADPGGSFSLPQLGVRMLIAAAVGVVLLFGAQRIFHRLQGDFAQEL
ncbi:transport permease protein [Cnuibacter physcomitrellae]|uniref:Transport permease protein n=1 Tax=Cnuibacter physcomitrellae TaxID=1619308 RepID=A0A1X9LVE3_9MICO|nr:ABC transporter permease [Cnuibacter physcomitrellae]ARJ06000.1 sugar ABC transporter [Cnuibacter physcomitrellae]MCS5496249.1 ABC transporter permease [Cnuibacter physcomitrellae]GGI36980.1 transport permease protein [Cnuibacter physcomitrellae]